MHAGRAPVDRGSGSVHPERPHGIGMPSRFTRFVSSLQIVGTLIGVPLGLASGYSIYRANFSVETSCQGLRNNIIAMLDKNVEIATRRILVRRDVAAFEQACDRIDPEATAAFKTLLAAEAAPATMKKKGPAPAIAEAVRKPDSQTAAAAKPQAEAAPEPEQRDTSLSDARWLAAVRQAMEAHGPEKTADKEPAQPARAVRPDVLGTIRTPAGAPLLQPAWNVPAVGAPTAAPVNLQPPPPADATRATQRDADHPVPPASIPVQAPPAGEARPVAGSWIAQIPLLGGVFERRSN
jgi:hypothetical protein